MRISFGIFFDIEREPKDDGYRESDLGSSHERLPDVENDYDYGDRTPAHRRVVGFVRNDEGN